MKSLKILSWLVAVAMIFSFALPPSYAFDSIASLTPSESTLAEQPSTDSPKPASIAPAVEAKSAPVQDSTSFLMGEKPEPVVSDSAAQKNSGTVTAPALGDNKDVPQNSDAGGAKGSGVSITNISTASNPNNGTIVLPGTVKPGGNPVVNINGTIYDSEGNVVPNNPDIRVPVYSDNPGQGEMPIEDLPIQYWPFKPEGNVITPKPPLPPEPVLRPETTVQTASGGRIETRYMLGSDGLNYISNTWEYDADGTLITETIYAVDAVIGWHIKEVRHYEPDTGDLSVVEEYEWGVQDGMTFVTQTISYYVDGVLNRTEVHDSRGGIRIESLYYEDQFGGQQTGLTENYNPDGVLVSMVYVDPVSGNLLQYQHIIPPSTDEPEIYTYNGISVFGWDPNEPFAAVTVDPIQVTQVPVDPANPDGETQIISTQTTHYVFLNVTIDVIKNIETGEESIVNPITGGLIPITSPVR